MSQSGLHHLSLDPNADDVVFAKAAFITADLNDGSVLATTKKRINVGARESLLVRSFTQVCRKATLMERVELERSGVDVAIVREMADFLGIPQGRLFDMIGLPKTTAQNLDRTKKPVSGASGQAALGMVNLLGIAQEIVERSGAEEAKNFDTAEWLGRWLDIPQPALGGLKAADLLDTPSGRDQVTRLLCALESGVYL